MQSGIVPWKGQPVRQTEPTDDCRCGAVGGITGGQPTIHETLIIGQRAPACASLRFAASSSDDDQGMDITECVKRNNSAPAQYDSKSCCTAQIRAFSICVACQCACRIVLSLVRCGSADSDKFRIATRFARSRCWAQESGKVRVLAGNLLIQADHDRRPGRFAGQFASSKKILRHVQKVIFSMDKRFERGDAAVRKGIES